VDRPATFFAKPSAWRAWLRKNHAKATELWVGFHKTRTGKPSLTWKESVDEALCFGWIDGLRQGIDDGSYRIRFTPRKATSIWSKANIARVAELEAEGRMTEAGRAAFAKRKEAKSGVYSFERESPAELPPEWQSRFEKKKKAWSFFSAQAPSYRRVAYHWVTSAKQEATRLRRFELLLADSEAGLRVGPHRPTKRSARTPCRRA
jgi:uncharacterized protein YdeI (YjbR/CyaY-like superfamily)